MRPLLRLLTLIGPIFCHATIPYSDSNLQQLWDSLSDIYAPSLEDYRLIEQYLSSGNRPYLSPFYQSLETMSPAVRAGNAHRLEKSILNFKLLGEHDELPIFEIHHLNPREGLARRCVLFYGSHNGKYPEKVRSQVKMLEKNGYSGDVCIRIGGFPNVQNGGLKIAHVPYAFKVAFFQEAQALGYQHILWLDTAINSSGNLEELFREIESQGHFFTFVGSLSDNFPSIIPTAAYALELSEEWYPYIYHNSTSMIGLNTDHPRSVQLLHDWFVATQAVYPNINWFPEELSFSACAWRLGCSPTGWFGSFCCIESEWPGIIHTRPSVQFFLDTIR